MKNDNIKIGKTGEEIACKFLIKNKYKILFRNYRIKFDEIDIIAKNSTGKIHFVEVKSVSCETIPNILGQPKDQASETKINNNFRPEDNVHQRKLQRLAKTIRIYLTERDVSDETEWQFDVITVYIDKKRLISKIYMLENIIL